MWLIFGMINDYFRSNEIKIWGLFSISKVHNILIINALV